MDYKTMKLNDIIEWCQENDEVAWLKKEAKKVNNDTPISFIELKRDFAKKFMPEILPVAKPKKPNMYEIIENL